MRKGFLLLLFSAIAFTMNVNAQCVPNTSITQPGIYPDSATGLTPGTLNQPYNQVLQVKVPTDTNVVILGSLQNVTINSITLTSFTNLPPGITYVCNPANCVYPGGSNGCALLSGTPTQAGTFNPTAITTTSATLTAIGLPITQIDTIDYYTIVINSTSSGFNTNPALRFELFQNDPNPFSNFTDIKFTSSHQAIVTLKVFNLIGKEVIKKSIQCQAGKNSYRLQADDLSPGVYMYTLSDGITTYTRRMIYSKR